ncbi:ribonuclease H-like domain-containing protein [Tanacetum coccineum]
MLLLPPPHPSTLLLAHQQQEALPKLHLFSSSTTSLVANSDADWAGCPTTRRSTFLATTYSLGPLSVNRHFLILVYRQSLSIVDLVVPGQVRVLHVPSRYQYADIFTKGLPSALFEEFHVSLSAKNVR